MTPAVRHAFTNDGEGASATQFCWTKSHFTRSAVSFLEWSSWPRRVRRRRRPAISVAVRLLHSRKANCRSSAAISANRD